MPDDLIRYSCKVFLGSPLDEIAFRGSVCGWFEDRIFCGQKNGQLLLVFVSLVVALTHLGL